MSPLIYTTSNTDEELSGILELQRENIPANLTAEEIITQGFVTVIHSFSDLKKLNDIARHVICKDGPKVIAYLLAMTMESKNNIPVLVPMFEVFTDISYRGKPVSAYNYLVVGQVCVHKNYRGKGILDKCYEAYKNIFSEKYDFAITEIACKNLRSVNAHKRIGFSEIHRYTSPGKQDWSIVAWNWLASPKV